MRKNEPQRHGDTERTTEEPAFSVFFVPLWFISFERFNDGKALRYKRLAVGVLVYSVGLDPRNPTGPGTDLGFRLWDVEHRRQPPAEGLPMPAVTDGPGGVTP